MELVSIGYITCNYQYFAYEMCVFLIEISTNAIYD